MGWKGPSRRQSFVEPHWSAFCSCLGWIPSFLCASCAATWRAPLVSHFHWDAEPLTPLVVLWGLHPIAAVTKLSAQFSQLSGPLGSHKAAQMSPVDIHTLIFHHPRDAGKFLIQCFLWNPISCWASPGCTSPGHHNLSHPHGRVELNRVPLHLQKPFCRPQGSLGLL